MDLAFLLFQKALAMLIYLIIGCICYKTKLITDIGNKSLSNVAMYALSPAMILVSFRQDYSDKLFHGLLMTVGLSCVGFAITIGGCLLLIRKKGILGKENKDAVIERFSAIYSNCGFMGIPLANELFGTEGVFYITAFHSVFMFLVWTYGVYLITGDKKDISLKKVFLNPSIIATILGAVLFIADIKTPQFLTSTMQPMSTAVGPLAMIIAGATIIQSDLKAAFTSFRIYWVAFLKLLLIPAILAVVLTLISKPFGISQTALLATILGFSCPSATIGTMLAIKFDKNAKAASQIFAFTTVVSVVTMPLIIYFQQLI